MLIENGRAAEAATLVQQFMAQNGQTLDALETLSVCLQVLERLDEALNITSSTIAARPPTTLDIRLASYASVSGRIARLDHRERARDLIVANMAESLPADDRARWRNNDLNALRRLAFLCPITASKTRRSCVCSAPSATSPPRARRASSAAGTKPASACASVSSRTTFRTSDRPPALAVLRGAW